MFTLIEVRESFNIAASTFPSTENCITIYRYANVAKYPLAVEL
jgi:hypothetical protein